MNWDQIEGNWEQIKGKVRTQLGKLTDDELTEAKGRRTQMLGLLQTRYGHARDVAEKTLDDWAATLK